MTTEFEPAGLSTWIGSLPVSDHKEAIRLMAAHTPEIPVWIQLPCHAAEGMIAQFLPGMPGLAASDDRVFIRTDDAAFDDQMVLFFESYMNVIDGNTALSDSIFVLRDDVAPGFNEFIKYLDSLESRPKAVKGQVTGPFTFSTGIKDQNGKAIFYHDQLRDVAVKIIAMKARWQAGLLKKYGAPVIIFLDEPGLAGFGTSAFISISRQDVEICLEEVIDAVHAEGGIAGVHVCANTDWALILDASADIVSFDSYSFFDKFILYAPQIKKFIDRGGILGWGIVPTGDINRIDQESVDSLFTRWVDQLHQLENLGIEKEMIIARSLVTPSCGTGSLPLHHAKRVIEMTRDLSIKIRQNFTGI